MNSHCLLSHAGHGYLLTGNTDPSNSSNNRADPGWSPGSTISSYMLSQEYWVAKHLFLVWYGCYSPVKIAFVAICACKNNQQIWHHNVSTSRSHDVTYQLWWHHNPKSENTILSDTGEMSDQWLFLSGWCVQDINKENKIGCLCIVEIRGKQGCALVGDHAQAVGECRDVAKAQP